METRAHHVLIGIFTVAIVSAAMLFGLWLAKGPTGGGFTYYDGHLPRIRLRPLRRQCGAV